MNFRLSVHALHVAEERKIPLEWITRAVESADSVETQPDGTSHYLKSIVEHGDRVLRVVLSTGTTPPVVVTVFFDRRMKGRMQ